jgi:hypothetical protein
MIFGNFRAPKNSDRYHWTIHSIEKMRFYGLSEQKILGVIRRPQRKEEGIVKNTTAVMQPVSPKIVAGKTVWKNEVWVMYQLRNAQNFKFEILNLKLNKNLKLKIKNSNQQIRIISAWRYPGVSPEKNPIPQDILREIEEDDLRDG